MKHKCYSKALKVASSSAWVRSYQSPNLTLGADKASGCRQSVWLPTAGKFRVCARETVCGPSAYSLGACLSAVLNSSSREEEKRWVEAVSLCVTDFSNSFQPLSPEDEVPLFPVSRGGLDMVSLRA